MMVPLYNFINSVDMLIGITEHISLSSWLIYKQYPLASLCVFVLVHTTRMQPLSKHQTEIIKASIPFLEKSGVDLTFGFYDYMFHTHPEVLPYFNQSNHKTLRQPKILAHALLQYAKNIDDLSPLTSFVQKIVEKHVGLQVKAEHYPIVGECLLNQLGKLLGSDIATPEFLKAWEIAYTNLAEILIQAELTKYEENSSLSNNWPGFKPFKVSKCQFDSSNVRSISFQPLDDKIVIPQPGQYICIRLTPDTNVITQRLYTISNYYDENTKSPEYRISVRLDPKGAASTYIHQRLQVGDIVHLSQPNGSLTYVNNNNDSKLILIAGGIGITPMISILQKALIDKRKVKLIWSNKTVDSLPFKKFFEDLQKQYQELLEIVVFITSEDKAGVEVVSDYHYRRLQKPDIQGIVPTDDVFLVGPNSFRSFVLENLDFNLSNVKTEEFGTMQV